MISTQFADYKHLPYRLYAVFVHHGTPEFGHYYIYIYDFKKKVWRKYNDGEVSEVTDSNEIFGNYGRANPPTPYFLVYVNADIKDRLADPVHREPTTQENTSDTSEEAGALAGEEGVQATEAMDVDPPSYEVSRASAAPPGPGAETTLAGEKEGPESSSEGKDAAEKWYADSATDLRGAQW